MVNSQVPPPKTTKVELDANLNPTDPDQVLRPGMNADVTIPKVIRRVADAQDQPTSRAD